jgi:predicted esterase/tetratricopeptide (TPR) repeat protein
MHASPPVPRSISLVPKLLIGAAAAWFATASPAVAQRLQLKDGRVISGTIARTSGVADNPEKPGGQAGAVATRPILVVDDELRRIFICAQRVANIVEQAPESLVTIKPWQHPAEGAARLVAVGPAINITPFDEYGRRIYEMQAADGPLSVVQGITELTPRYTKLSSLHGPQRAVAWEASMATSSLPSDVIAKVMTRAIPQDDWQARLQAVRWYAQAGRYPDARRELEKIIEEFPDQEGLKSEVSRLRQMGAKQLLTELELRRAAGQHELVGKLLESFPAEEVAGETLIQVREMLTSYEQENRRLQQIANSLQATVAAISDPDHRGLAAPIADEIVKELSHNTVDRLAPFIQLLDDDSLTAEEKTSLAITGWLMGAEEAKQEINVALALIKIRDAVLRYLREPLAADRQLVLESITSMEEGSVPQIAKLISRMKPPWHDEAYVTPRTGAYLTMTAPGQTEDGDFTYHIQLPPEYDPYRKYPTLLVLNGTYNTPEQELEFWAGAPVGGDEKNPPVRHGQSMRHGYITIAVDWQKPHQYDYEYSGREHVAVLTSLRDAMRRFSIDADRIYLTGHDIGGEAAWDMAQSHPDIWAGAMPFIPRPELEQKYIAHTWENAEYVPLYFVAGQLDGRTVPENAKVWNKYLRLGRFDTTLAEYKGRGHEPFHDEILQLFDWMGFKKRSGPPQEFDCGALRPWDNFFWWLEVAEYPNQFMIYPTDWSGGRVTPAHVSGRIMPDNRLTAKTVGNGTTIWLGPDFVDFSKPIRLTFNNRKVPDPPGGFKPDVSVLLEDVRTRADRQRPFWAKVEMP